MMGAKVRNYVRLGTRVPVLSTDWLSSRIEAWQCPRNNHITHMEKYEYHFSLSESANLSMQSTPVSPFSFTH